MPVMIYQRAGPEVRPRPVTGQAGSGLSPTIRLPVRALASQELSPMARAPGTIKRPSPAHSGPGWLYSCHWQPSSAPEVPAPRRRARRLAAASPVSCVPAHARLASGGELEGPISLPGPRMKKSDETQPTPSRINVIVWRQSHYRHVLDSARTSGHGSEARSEWRFPFRWRCCLGLDPGSQLSGAGRIMIEFFAMV
jgi:hypothetical protein